VQRNQPFEFVAASMAPFLAYAGLSVEFQYSAYDDSLAAVADGSADIEIVWLDFSRYAGFAEFDDWLRGRLARLRLASPAPILLVNSPGLAEDAAGFNRRLEAVAEAIPGVYLCDQVALARKLGNGYFDPRISGIAAMTLSSAACLELGRMFGLVWIPAVAGTPIKAIALDLDNTLYSGVLGEDGPEGVTLTPAHQDLHRQLLACREQGIFLAIVSRNESGDVAQLFRARPDFPLQIEHFSAQSISWQPKAAGICAAAPKLRIGTDAILFLDDNAGELSAVATEIPEVRSLYAADAAEAARALRLYPGLSGARPGATGQLRVADLDANTAREQMRQETPDRTQYLRSLEARLTFFCNPHQQLQRLHQLSVKTNQFNTAFLRLTEAEVARRLGAPDCVTISVALRDKLADSGVIAALFGRWQENILHLEEVVISCRALGRELESILISEAIRGIVERADDKQPVEVEFAFVPGPRNQPASEWLERFTGRTQKSGETVKWKVDGNPAGPGNAAAAVFMEWKDEEDGAE
jgi:FkbH-like protein